MQAEMNDYKRCRMDFDGLKGLFDAHGAWVGIAGMAFVLGWRVIKKGFSFSMKMDVGSKK
jgi:hypothetical protein